MGSRLLPASAYGKDSRFACIFAFQSDYCNPNIGTWKYHKKCEHVE
jgi:hypothetical protein